MALPNLTLSLQFGDLPDAAAEAAQQAMAWTTRAIQACCSW